MYCVSSQNSTTCFQIDPTGIIKEEASSDKLSEDPNTLEELMTPQIVIKEEFSQLIKEESVIDLGSLETLPTEFIDVGETTIPKIEIKCEPDIENETNNTSLQQGSGLIIIPRPTVSQAENRTNIETDQSQSLDEPETCDLIPVALDSMCRGCGQSFTQIVRHLQPFSYKVSPCMRKYTPAEIENHKRVLGNCAECSICHSKIYKACLSIHKAVVHFKKQYITEIKEQQKCSEVDPETCPWDGCEFGVKSTSHGLRKVNSMIKHYQTHVSIVDIVHKYNSKEGDVEKPVETEILVYEEETKRKMFCKTCKNLFAVKTEGKLQLVNMDTKNNCNQCKNQNLEIVCRVCNLNIKSPEFYTMQQKAEHIVKHLDSDKHYQKEQVFDFYCLYAGHRGFDSETDLNMDNLIFFLSVMKVKALHCQIHDKNILSLIVNIFNLSMSQYSDLQKHMDHLLTSKIPSFGCFSCNFLADEIDDLKTHIETEQHGMSMVKIQTGLGESETLFCSKCVSHFNIDTFDEHTGHRLYEGDEDPISSNVCPVVVKPKAIKNKRKNPEVIEGNNIPSKTYKSDDDFNNDESSTNPILSESDRLPGIIDTKCRGCGRSFNRIIKHLQPSRFKAGLCMKHYSEIELAIHKKKIVTIKNLRHNAKNKERTRCNGAYRSKQLFCKSCKELFAFKSNGSVQLTSEDSRSKCESCKNPNLGVICRVCNVKIRSLDHFPFPQKYQFIQKHLDSDNHIQKEQVLELYSTYAKLRGFDMEDVVNVDNLRFFITAMKAKTLGGRLAAKNSLSVLLNILDLSTEKFIDLKGHIENIGKVGNPNFFCFSCNFLVFGDIEELKEHTDTKDHAAASSHGIDQEGKNLSCSQCDVFFNEDCFDYHSGHGLNHIHHADGYSDFLHTDSVMNEPDEI